MHQFVRRSCKCLVAFAVVVYSVGAACVFAQEPKEENTESSASIEIEPYTGPPIFLDEPEAQPNATLVGKVVDSQNYADGKLRYEREIAKYSDNRLVAEGFYREFYKNGEKFVEGQFADGKQDGEWTYWHDNGQIARTANYSDGQPDGAWEVYNRDGKVIAQRSYKAGKRDGTWVVYDKDGKQPQREEQYADGLADGIWKVWFPNGQLQSQLSFKQGNRDGTSTLWLDTGEKRAEVNYRANVLDGTATLWGADGTKIEQRYEDGKLVEEKKD